MKFTFIPFVLCLVAGCVASDSSDEDIESITQASHSWAGYHWRKTGPTVTVQLNNNLSSLWTPYLNIATHDWSLSEVLSTTISPGTKNPSSCKPTLGKIEVCNSKYGKNGWLGIAQVWVNGDHIVQATVKLNDSYFASPPYNTTPWKRMVVCQEVAHTFGLDHQDEIMTNPNLGSCMDYTNNPSGPPSNEHPNAHDYEELDIIYSHVDSLQSTQPTRLQGNAFVITHTFPAN